MAIKMTGLVSNLDTDSIIKELMSVQSTKKTKIEQNKKKLEWEQDKWKEMNTKIYALYTDQVSKLRLQGNYATRKTSSSDEGKVTATAAASAANGSYSLKINQLAASQYVTGSDMSDKGWTSSTLLTETGMHANTKISINTGENLEDLTALTVDTDTTIADFLTTLTNAGLNASFDEKQGRFFINAGASGSDNRFTITTGTVSGEEISAMNVIEAALDYDTFSNADKSKVQGAYAQLRSGDATQVATGRATLISLAEAYERTAYQTDLETGISSLISAVGGSISLTDPRLTALGLGEITQDIAENGQTGTGMIVQAAADSSITLNGANITGSTNNITVSGITFNLTATTAADETLNVTVSHDVEAAYEMIKGFTTQYNELITSMSELYYADSAKGYDMLTDEDKESMSDDQITLWEDKIKNSLLRRDSTLGMLMSSFRTALQTSVEIDEKNYSLSSFGIVTGTYTERGILHINGDDDDATYAEKTDKLTAALNEDPEKVAKVLSGIVTNLYETMNDKMKSSTLSSAMTFYNDKQMKKQVEDYDDQIDLWADRLQSMEDRYYDQFSAMEVSMQRLQSQQNSLANMLGG